MSRESRVAEFAADLNTMKTRQQIRQYADRRTEITQRFTKVLVARMKAANSIAVVKNLRRCALED